MSRFTGDRQGLELQALEQTVIHATDRGTLDGREPIRWKLVTNLPVACKADAIEKLDWYALRWKIEMFHGAA